MDVIEMMKIEKLLTISDKDIVRVQDFNDKDKKQIDKKKFHHGKSQRKESRLEAKVYVILKEDFDDYEEEVKSKMTELEESIERLENQLSSIDKDHQKELKKLDDEYSAKVDELNKDLHEKDLEIERTKTKYEKELGLFREDIQKEINKLELYDEEYHMKITDHQKEVSGIKDRIVRETIHHNDNLNSLEKNLDLLEDKLNLIGFIKGRPKSKLKELKESTSELKKDIEAFRYIAQYIESKKDDEVQDVKLKKDG